MDGTLEGHLAQPPTPSRAKASARQRFPREEAVLSRTVGGRDSRTSGANQACLVPSTLWRHLDFHVKNQPRKA